MPEGNSIHTSHHKDELKIGTHLSIKYKMIKLQEDIRQNLHDPGLSEDFFIHIIKTQMQIKELIIWLHL